MTYKYKLSRRLAISRRLSMVSVLWLLAACTDETTGPDTSLPQLTDVTKVVPASVTIETNQQIRFRSETVRGRVVPTTLTWRSSGGTISTDGVFSAASVGTYKVVGRGRGRQKADTSIVTVVPSPTGVVAIQVTPGDTSVNEGASRTFTATAILSDSTTSPIGVTWAASGGTIDAGGVYQAGSTAGKFHVIATWSSGAMSDTAVVDVAAPDPTLVDVVLKPASYSLTTGGSKQFSAYGHNSLGDSVAVQASFNATGGTITSGGLYTAGSTTGTYRVVASASGLADTAAVTLTAPTLVDVVLKPASYSMSTGTSKQFTAYGHNSLGDSVAVQASFSATGGTITTGGLYTAGTTGGTYRVIASASGHADTAAVTLSAPTSPTPTSTGTGLPFGMYRLLISTSDPGPLTLSAESNSASTIATRIDYARQRGVHVMLAMTGGAHSDYMSTIDGVYQFDRSKWEAKLATFNTSAIKNAIAAGVSDGTIVGATVMDEPYVWGGPSGGGNTWGPQGTMTKARVDSLCTDVQRLFPTLPAGVEHQHQLFEPDKSYHVCQFIVDQYGSQYGDVATWRDAGLAMAARDHHAILFSLNVLDGGVQDKDGTYDCTGAGQAGKGTYAPNCRMTASMVKTYGAALGPYGCGLFMWRYDDAFATNTDNQAAFKDVATRMASSPSRACRRS
jgi:hypothetical protein